MSFKLESNNYTRGTTGDKGTTGDQGAIGDNNSILINCKPPTS